MSLHVSKKCTHITYLHGITIMYRSCTEPLFYQKNLHFVVFTTMFLPLCTKILCRCANKKFSMKRWEIFFSTVALCLLLLSLFWLSHMTYYNIDANMYIVERSMQFFVWMIIRWTHPIIFIIKIPPLWPATIGTKPDLNFTFFTFIFTEEKNCTCT